MKTCEEYVLNKLLALEEQTKDYEEIKSENERLKKQVELFSRLLKDATVNTNCVCFKSSITWRENDPELYDFLSEQCDE